MQTITLNEKAQGKLNLANKVILITGAGDGIGRALAIACAKEGATTILLGKSLKKLEAVYDEIMSQNLPEPAIHPLNLLQAQPKDAYALAESIHNLFGKLDAVVHNAGISGQITPLEHLAPEKWQEVVQLNLNVPYLLTHALLPLLKMSDSPSILFTTADEAKQAKAYWSAYSASKFGVRGLAQSLHEELDNTAIRVNCINPGKVRTNLRIKVYPGIDPLTFPAPEEIVPHYVYLLSEQGKHIKGNLVNVA
ncbi:MAG: YciK family oxidoreductase [Proteobacteria bacterium]|nr:YciK family oxidoreductase [Pseudomonadota bacterium]